MRYLLFLIVFASCLPIDWVEPIPPPFGSEPLESDTCVPVEVLEPKFITGYVESELLEPVLWHVGALVGDSLEALLEQLNPDLSYQVFKDSLAVAVIAKGTNDKVWITNKVWARTTTGAKAYMVFNIQGFYFGGALDFDEYQQAIADYPSVASFNFRSCGFTQEQYDKLSLDILECKLGRNRADFRFNEITDTIPPLFIAAGWDNVYQ